MFRLPERVLQFDIRENFVENVNKYSPKYIYEYPIDILICTIYCRCFIRCSAGVFVICCNIIFLENKNEILFPRNFNITVDTLIYSNSSFRKIFNSVH